MKRLDDKNLRFILFYLLVIVGLTLSYAAIFVELMKIIEGRRVSFTTAIYWVIQTMTTVGYGDIELTTDFLRAFSIVVQLTGILMLFGMFIPFVIVPMVEERLKNLIEDFPRVAPEELKDHIIICGYNPMVASLITELQSEKHPFIVVDPIRESIEYLVSHKIPCILGDPTKREVLIDARIEHARKLLANMDDETNASIVLLASSFPNIEIIAIVEDVKNSKYLAYAGADRVISPKQIYGTQMGMRATGPLVNEVLESVEFFKNLRIVELPIFPGSMLIGKSLREAEVRFRTGVHVVGIWNRGELTLGPSADEIIQENSVLLCVGTMEQLSRLRALTTGGFKK
ncbi:MAG TPA: potassium channel protein [Candidatus Syntrophoarchaeum butanivorans]|uniref:Potassium channel protein n=1 Tax=Candidatus Syntropharchaeum butanivorans TaxID=1839936 RepID=A0A7C0X3E6_9EURY|nr:potassium channel protein [Candidatus Syntrophoarchaeum butanivorans]